VADHLTPLDAVFLELEDGDAYSHMHIGCALGAPLRQVLPLVPIFTGHSVGVAAVSYDGEVTFRLNADHAGVPDLEVLEHGIEESLVKLRRAARATRGQCSGQTPPLLELRVGSP